MVAKRAELTDRRKRSVTRSQNRTVDGRTALLDGMPIDRPEGREGLRIERSPVTPAPSLIYYHFGDRATLLRTALEYVAEKAATYTETDHEASGRDALVETLAAEIQDDSEIRENSAAWGVPRPHRLR